MSDAIAGYDAAEEFLDRQSTIKRVQAVLHAYPWLSPAIVLAITVIIFRIATSKFATPTDLGVIAQQTAVTGTLAIGQTLIINVPTAHTSPSQTGDTSQPNPNILHPGQP